MTKTSTPRTTSESDRPTSWSIRPLGDSFEGYVSIASEALLNDQLEQWQGYLQRVGKENFRTVWSVDRRGVERLVGGIGFYRMGQWICGRALPTAGFSGVAISPEARGTGACAALLRGLLRELRDEGVPLASLYASTQSLYRSVGFEQAGVRLQYQLPLGSLCSEGRDYPVERYDEPPYEQLSQIDELRGRVSSGVLRRTRGLWDRLLVPPGRDCVTYILGPQDSPTGYAILLKGTRSEGIPQPLTCIDYVASNAATLRRLGTLFYDHRALCDSLRWPGGADDSLLGLAREQRIKVIDQLIHMNRIIDLPAVLTGRGYNPHVAGRLDIEVTDPVIPENENRWVIEIEHGRARVEQGGRGTLKMNVAACAPLLTSHYTATQLYRLGWIETDEPEFLPAADALLVGPRPWMADLF